MPDEMFEAQLDEVKARAKFWEACAKLIEIITAPLADSIRRS